jgi:hypothetical protein
MQLDRQLRIVERFPGQAGIARAVIDQKNLQGHEVLP